MRACLQRPAARETSRRRSRLPRSAASLALQPSALLRRHRLKLVSTSKVCDLRLREAAQSPADAFVLGDAMAASPSLVEDVRSRLGEAPGDALSLTAASSTALATSVSGGTTLSRVDAVAASLAAAAAAASAAAVGAYSAVTPYAGPLANNITTFTASVAGSLPVRSVAAQLQSAAAVGHSSAIATVATVSAALESTWGRDRLPKECQSPTEWYICDDGAGHTRYFVLQASR